jgi:hypothetical protein
VLVTPWRSVYFNSLALSKRYLSIARRMSSATGAPVFSDSFCSFLICSSLRKRAVRFMTHIMPYRHIYGNRAQVLGIATDERKPQPIPSGLYAVCYSPWQ